MFTLKSQIKTALVFILLFFLFTQNSHSQTGEKNLSTWLFFNHRIRLSEKFSTNFTVQERYYEVLDNLNQRFALIGVRYHFNKNVNFMWAFNYLETKSFDKGETETVSHDKRWIHQLAVSEKWGRISVSHRLRIENRWLSRPGDDDFENRYRQWLWLRLPLNSKSISSGTFFLSAYDEVFLNFQHDVFGQNRLYGGVGYQLSEDIRLEAGYMKNHFRGRNFDRLQLSLFLSTDLRKPKN